METLNKIDKYGHQRGKINDNDAEMHSRLTKGLSVYKDDTTLFGYYPKLEGLTDVEDMGDLDCDPVYLEGGSALTDLQFSQCAYEGDFTITDTSGLTSLTSLNFSYCGYQGSGNFLLSDTSGLTSLTSLTFSECAHDTFTLSDTSGLTSLTSLNFSYCGYGSGNFLLSDTSGLTSLVTLYINRCSADDLFLPTTADAVGTLTALTSFTISIHSGPTSATELKLIADACLANPVVGGIFKLFNDIAGDTTALNAVLTQLRATPKLWDAPAV